YSPIRLASSATFPTRSLRASVPRLKRLSEPRFFSTSRTPPALSVKSRKLRLKGPDRACCLHQARHPGFEQGRSRPSPGTSPPLERTRSDSRLLASAHRP